MFVYLLGAIRSVTGLRLLLLMRLSGSAAIILTVFIVGPR